ncbi:peptide MFS transporter [Parvicella tangerina]|uniref:Dipeptide and tripeptide permease A n=1 Tax=Parvicella tangerina TaxID=2829795 RepID=A0A916JPY3_9FLAO|nr:peptide MFS transporter [Parvicella tangerina]CAG5085018.1 Dipeptide and tripeptide permease A [Parvicella tangerina]
MSSIKTSYTEQLRVMGHPAGLFVLFFTEMWERFSYYGMRALLVLFLVSAAGIGGWEWSNAEALTLYGIYTGLVYVTPIFGGLIADKLTGYRMAIVIGAFLMTAGHASMAFETEFTFYLGLALLILGNGMFKPNISSIVGQLYNKDPEKKDAGYTIFYMGINAGAFLGILLCGYVGEKVGWSYGFGLAGVFMFIGMIMFYFAQNIFDQIGLKPTNNDQVEDAQILDHQEEATEHSKEDILDSATTKASPEKIKRDRLLVIGILAFFTIFFWMAFEQAGGSMTLFARNFTDRILTGSAATSFTVINTIITIVPLAVITYVLIMLFKATFKKFALSNVFLGLSFAIIWGIVGWMINKDFSTKAYEISFAQEVVNEETEEKEMKDITTVIRTDEKIAVDQSIFILDVDNEGTYRYLNEETASKVDSKIEASVVNIKESELEVPASWFGILNSLFIILFAPLFSKIWESKYNPSAPVKFGVGLILLGLGFGVLAFGSMAIPTGAETASVSMIFLILAYLLHTLGELAVSPVGLSYVSKLSPANLVGLMFGVWFGATALANYAAGWTGSYIDKISESVGLSGFFFIYTAIPVAAGLLVMALNKFLTKRMHGIR